MSRDLVDDMGGGHGRPPRDISADDDRPQKSNLHDLTLAIHYDTGKAILVSETGEEAKAVWLPKSQVEIHDTGKQTTGVKKNGETIMLPLAEVTLPEWLAKKNGLI